MLVRTPPTANVWYNMSNLLTHVLTVTEQQNVTESQLLERVNCLQEVVQPLNGSDKDDHFLLVAAQL